MSYLPPRERRLGERSLRLSFAFLLDLSRRGSIDLVYRCEKRAGLCGNEKVQGRAWGDTGLLCTACVKRDDAYTSTDTPEQLPSESVRQDRLHPRTCAAERR